MTPNKENLIEIIKNGDDSHHNVLVLNLDGSFELINGCGEEDVQAVKGNNYVARWETYCPGNRYVGKDTSNDIKYMNDLYASASNAWDEYKKTGKYPDYIDII
ncbi:MAG: hypothetical protein NC177_10155 [Ruminococcus flavefaciens]|nr:hypothetical protein [Ruminococcus flavefaciens]